VFNLLGFLYSTLVAINLAPQNPGTKTPQELHKTSKSKSLNFSKGKNHFFHQTSFPFFWGFHLEFSVENIR